MNFDTTNFLPLIFIIIVMFILMMIGALEKVGSWVVKTWRWIFDPYFEFDNDTYDQYGIYRLPRTNYTPYQNKAKKTCLPHLHRWEFERKEKHNWSMVGKNPVGSRNHIDNIISVTTERPGHTETKLSTLIDWRRQGFNVVYTSWNHWKCGVCGEIKQTEFYETPTKEDPSTAPPVLTLNELIDNIDRNKKIQQTNTNTTTYRREFAVEPVKWYR